MPSFVRENTPAFSSSESKFRVSFCEFPKIFARLSGRRGDAIGYEQMPVRIGLQASAQAWFHPEAAGSAGHRPQGCITPPIRGDSISSTG